MKDAMSSLHENHTYELTDLPEGEKALHNKRVYKLKLGEGENPPRFNHCGDGVSVEKRCGFRPNICHGRKNVIDKDDFEHCSQHKLGS